MKTVLPASVMQNSSPFSVSGTQEGTKQYKMYLENIGHIAQRTVHVYKYCMVFERPL